MEKTLIAAIPILIVVIAGIVSTCVISIWKWNDRKKSNPITIKLLRAPGEGLQKLVRELDWEVAIYLLFATFMPLLFVTVHLSESYLAGLPETASRLLFNVAGMFSITIYMIYHLYVSLKKRENLRLGLDAERAVGQELNKLTALGYRVFHDVPGDKFNIDHVVIGKNGLFVIETKGRSKKIKGDGKREFNVIYDGEKLIFPTWKEAEPIAQVKQTAKWLSQEITKAINESVRAEPVLCIAGWFIERKSKQPPVIFNGKNPEDIIPKLTAGQLSDTLIQRIAYQIEQWVNDVEPGAYKKFNKE